MISEGYYSYFLESRIIFHMKSIINKTEKKYQYLRILRTMETK